MMEYFGLAAKYIVPRLNLIMRGEVAGFQEKDSDMQFKIETMKTDFKSMEL